jgi:hypothetical protein
MLRTECLGVVVVVAARARAGVARDLWDPTRALPWADMFWPLRGISTSSYRLHLK